MKGDASWILSNGHRSVRPKVSENQELVKSMSSHSSVTISSDISPQMIQFLSEPLSSLMHLCVMEWPGILHPRVVWLPLMSSNDPVTLNYCL